MHKSIIVLIALALCFINAPSFAQETTASVPATSSSQSITNAAQSPGNNSNAISEFITSGPEKWTSPQGLHSTLQVMLLLTVLSMAPAILLMTTCFVRIIVVLGLLKQAIGANQLPPSQVMTAIAMFMTILLMTPVWSQVYTDAILPYTQEEIGLEQAWNRGVGPIRSFMSRQIEVAGNSDDVWLFYEHLPEAQKTKLPETYDDIPLQVLIPAFMLSELKTAFLIGFQVYLPFLILDIVVSTVTISVGMMMLPPAMISLPFKLLLFVLVDGWTLVVGMLLESFSGAG
jgi:flagellar biosynthesis protein FliP